MEAKLSANISNQSHFLDDTILLQAIRNRDLLTINKILNQNTNWKATDDNGGGVLHLAFSNKERIIEEKQKIIKILVRFFHLGWSMNLKNLSGKTILYSAVENRLIDVVDFLVNNGADVNIRDQNGNSIVHFLIEDQFIKYSDYCDFPKPLEDRIALEHEDIEFMTFLLAKGMDVDCKNNNGKTPLDLAIDCDLQHIMPILIRHMNDVTHLDEEGRTLIEVFFARKNIKNKKVTGISVDFEKVFTTYNIDYKLRYEVDIVKFLLNKGVSVNHVNNQGDTLVHIFLKTYIRSQELIRWMVLRYTNVDHQDKNGNTALHLFVMKSRAFCLWNNMHYMYTSVCKLLSNGADTRLKNNRGETAVQLAVRMKRIEILKTLKRYGADLSPSANGGNLLFELLFEEKRYLSLDEKKYAPMIRMLVLAGNNANEIIQDGLTPLKKARMDGCHLVAQKLIENGATE